MRRLLHASLMVLCLAACGKEREAKEPVDASATGDLTGRDKQEPAEDSAAGDLAAEPARLCDGSEQIRLAVAIEGGGQVPAGAKMLSENGWRFLLVDGKCRAWVLRSHTQSLLRLTLSAAQEAALFTALQLSDWQHIEGQHQGGCPDAPGIRYRFANQHIQGATCGLAATDPLQTLNANFMTQLELLSTAASPVTGDLRYLVVVEPSPNDSRPAVDWPLSIPIASVALLPGDEFNYKPGDSKRATGAEADLLRGLRATNQDDGSGTVYDFTRVRDPSGATYQLFIRDSAPGEQPNGLLPADTL